MCCGLLGAVPSKAWALIVMQIVLFAMNVRGAAKTDGAPDQTIKPDD